MPIFDFLADGQKNPSAINKFFENPANIKLLADLGAGIGSDVPIGQALGGAATEYLQQDTLRKLIEQQQRKKPNLLNLVSDSLSGTSDLLSPRGDMGGFDQINLTDDKITFTAPNLARRREGIPREQPLEMRRRPETEVEREPSRLGF